MKWLFCLKSIISWKETLVIVWFSKGHSRCASVFPAFLFVGAAHQHQTSPSILWGSSFPYFAAIPETNSCFMSTWENACSCIFFPVFIHTWTHSLKKFLSVFFMCKWLWKIRKMSVEKPGLAIPCAESLTETKWSRAPRSCSMNM